ARRHADAVDEQVRVTGVLDHQVTRRGGTASNRAEVEAPADGDDRTARADLEEDRVHLGRAAAGRGRVAGEHPVEGPAVHLHLLVVAEVALTSVAVVLVR